MTGKETRIAVQKLLFPNEPREWDGIFGRKTKGRLETLGIFDADAQWDTTGIILRGDGTWAFTAELDGDDIVVRNVRATCFGGTNDPQDSGDTASGISTKPPETLGVALPMFYNGSHGPTREALRGTPLPRVPWFTNVAVTSGGKTHTFPVIDLGPARHTKNALDLSVAAARKFKPDATATNFAMTCSYRILGGAKYAV